MKKRITQTDFALGKFLAYQIHRSDLYSFVLSDSVDSHNTTMCHIYEGPVTNSALFGNSKMQPAHYHAQTFQGASQKKKMYNYLPTVTQSVARDKGCEQKETSESLQLLASIFDKVVRGLPASSLTASYVDIHKECRCGPEYTRRYFHMFA